MDEVLLGWIFLFVLVIWRRLQQSTCMPCRLREACFLQWYNIALVLLVILLLRTVLDFIKFEYFHFAFLTSAEIRTNLYVYCGAQGKSTQECIDFQEQLELFYFLRLTCLLAPVCGFVGFVMLSKHLWGFVGEFRRAHEGKWLLAQRVDWVVIINGTPLVFVVMALRSLIRILAVMTGSCWAGIHDGGEDAASLRFAQRRTTQLEISTYQLDIDLAITFQYISVWMFGELCTSFLKKSKYVQSTEIQASLELGANHAQEGEKYMSVLARLSLQGVWTFVIIGMFRSVQHFITREIQTFSEIVDSPEAREWWDGLFKILSQVSTYVNVVFFFATVLCIVNMFVISGVKDLKDGFEIQSSRCLGKTTTKFLGTRMLLIFSQLQPVLINAFTSDSKLQRFVFHNSDSFPQLAGMLQAFSLSAYQAKLLHASLLNYECLFVVILTCLSWPPEQVMSALIRTPSSARIGLLEAEAAARSRLEPPRSEHPRVRGESPRVRGSGAFAPEDGADPGMAEIPTPTSIHG